MFKYFVLLQLIDSNKYYVLFLKRLLVEILLYIPVRNGVTVYSDEKSNFQLNLSTNHATPSEPTDYYIFTHYLSVSTKYPKLAYIGKSLNYFFWLGTQILLYVYFTYFNIFSEDPAGSFTIWYPVSTPIGI